LAIDVWEHAYFLQYLNLRNDYIESFFRVINWDFADDMYRRQAIPGFVG
jgi:Fe-Mn family superoxide dismutase